jgi:hypothetical protein
MLTDPVAMAKAFEFCFRDREGQLWKTQPSLINGTVMSLKYGGDVFRNGVKVGGVGRRVTQSGPGKFRVEHLNLTISMVEARKKGFAEQYWADALKRYPSFGIDEVTILAVDDGRCFWARDPVQFEDAELARKRLAAWPSPDGGATPAGSAAFAHDAVASGLAQQNVTAVIKDIEDLNRNLSPADLYATKTGQILLDRASWRGVVDL